MKHKFCGNFPLHLAVRLAVTRSIMMLRKFPFRSLTTKTQQHVPPKRLPGITGRYAGAVYTAASKVILIFFDLLLHLTLFRLEFLIKLKLNYWLSV